MAPIAEAEKGEVPTRVLHELSKTPYACTSLTRLTNGTTNFVFRGVLAQPLDVQDGTSVVTIKSVIIKHTTDFVAANKNFPLDVSRCVSLSVHPRLTKRRLPRHDVVRNS